VTIPCSNQQILGAAKHTGDTLLINFIILLAGIAIAGLGGDIFVRGAVGLGRWARISPAIIGVTIAAFATSSPELSVAINSALSGTPQISLGDCLGSNVVNIALILAIALLISNIKTTRESIKRDFPVALFIPLLTLLLFIDNNFSRLDGIITISIFLTWLIFTILHIIKHKKQQAQISTLHPGLILLFCTLGLILLITAGKCIVHGASNIAATFGISSFIIGATIVAVGTSVPELATTIISKLRGHDDISLGTIIGSNIFNGSFIIPLAAIINPINQPVTSIIVPLAFSTLCLFTCYPTRSGTITKQQGVILLGIYIIYIVLVLTGVSK
jgi:cation:H+ antiporter